MDRGVHPGRLKRMSASEQSAHAQSARSQDPAAVRDPLAVPEAVLAARRRPMSERLELALSWNAMAAELRAGMARLTGRPTDDRAAQ
jgi:hypothetical protein